MPVISPAARVFITRAVLAMVAESTGAGEYNVR
jgi:hypothetical protein